VADAATLLADIAVAANATPGPRTLTVTTGSQVVTLQNAYNVLSPSAPAITSLTPPQGEPGLSTTVTIAAQNTAFAQGQTQVSLGDGITVSPVTVSTATSLSAQITIAATASAGPRAVIVTTGSQVATLANAFAVTPPSPPSITGLSPGSGQQGQTLNVQISGWNTSFTPGQTQVTCGAGITVSSLAVVTTQSLSMQFQIAADALLGPRDLTVSTGMEVVTLPSAFFVTTSAAGTPTINSVTPAAGPVGITQTVTIAGTNLGLAQGQTWVTFGDGIDIQNVTVISLNQMTVDVAPSLSAPPGTRTVTVTTGPTVVSLDSGFTVSGPLLSIASPETLSFVNTPVITVAGQVSDPAAVLTVNGVTTPNASGSFSTSVPLSEGNNTVTVAARSAGWATSTAAIRINLDTTPPHLAILSPPAGFQTADASITVSGMVNDIVVGTVNDQDATVTVNGVQAAVQNRTFSATVPLALGTNPIQVVARDRVGNQSTASVAIQRAVSTQLRIVSGNNQTGPIQQQLPAPLIVELDNSLGVPVANGTVVFRVAGNDGGVAAQSGGQGKPSIVQTTDAQGRAMAAWTLGSRAGQSNNRVEATSPGVVGAALFSASGTAATPTRIVVDSGLNQSGATGELLPLPFIAVVVDAGNNRLPGVPVTFTVQQGGGALSTTVAKLNSIRAVLPWMPVTDT